MYGGGGPKIPGIVKKKYLKYSYKSETLVPFSPLATFFFRGMNRDFKGRHFADVAEVQREWLAALDTISAEDFRQCLQQWKRRWDRCIQSQREYFEGD